MSNGKASTEGQVWTLAAKIVRATPDAFRGMDFDTMQAWIDDPGDGITRALSRGFMPPVGEYTGTVYPLTINRDLTREAMIKAGGYNYINPNLTAKRFPVRGKGVKERKAVLVHFNRNISTDDAKREIEVGLGLTLGDTDGLCALGADPRYRDFQREFPIAELGQVSGGLVACLYGGGTERCLGLYDVRFDWVPHDRFLAFSK